MHPFLIDLGTRTLPLIGAVRLALPTYGALVATALLVGWVLLLRGARRDGLDVDRVASAGVWALVGGIVGGKLGLILVEAPTYLSAPGQIVSIDFLRAAGLVWTAVLGGAAALVVAARCSRLPVARVLDVAALALPVCQAIGRIGCLAAGCCYGGACSLPWAIVYHSAEAHSRTDVPLDQPLHPTPLYEALWSAAVVLPILLWLRRRKDRPPGEIAAAYVVCYGVGRFAVEFTRGDAIRGLWFGGALSSSQLVSLLAVPGGAASWILLRRRWANRAKAA